jgi:chaperonin GroES
VPLQNLVWDYDAPSFEAAPRKTEIITLYPHQVRQNELARTFLEISYGSDTGEDGGDANDSEAPRVFLEQHRRYDLDGDGYAEPWIVTVHKQSQKVVRIVGAFDAEGIHENASGAITRIKAVDYYTLFGLLPNVKGGSYPMGFGHMLKPINEGINTTLNQMFDAGHLANTGSGLIGANLSMHAGPVNFQIGQFKPVNNKGQSIRDSVYQFQWPGPSQTLFQLLGFMVQAGKEVAAIQDIITDPGVVTAQPTTLLAIIETGMRVYTAIYKGIYRSLKSEFDKLYRLNRLYLPEDSKYERGDEWRTITQSDYRLGGGVKPVADPTMVTDIQQLGRAGVLLQFKDDPVMNPLEVRRRYLEAAHITDIDKLLPKVMPPPPPNPEMLDIQVKQQELVATLGRTRAQELQAYTQAMLNFAKAKAGMNQPQIDWMEAMLGQMRLQIEAINSTIRAADVDAKMHGHAVTAHGNILQHRASLADIQQRARELAHGPGTDESGTGGPGPTPVQPVAPPPGNTAFPPIPGGPGGPGPANGAGAVGG